MGPGASTAGLPATPGVRLLAAAGGDGLTRHVVDKSSDSARWVRVNNSPPGCGLQILVLGTIYQGSPCWVPFFDPQPYPSGLARNTAKNLLQGKKCKETCAGRIRMGAPLSRFRFLGTVPSCKDILVYQFRSLIPAQPWFLIPIPGMQRLLGVLPSMLLVLSRRTVLHAVDCKVAFGSCRG